jgi:hypothetical protein
MLWSIDSDCKNIVFSPSIPKAGTTVCFIPLILFKKKNLNKFKITAIIAVEINLCKLNNLYYLCITAINTAIS